MAGKSAGTPEDWRQLWVSEDDVDLLLSLLKKERDDYGMVKRLEKLKADFHDGLLKLRELEARVKSHGFFGDPVHRGQSNLQFHRQEKRKRHKELATDLEKEEDERETQANLKRMEEGE